jgi:hypothetical protein
MPTSNFDPNMFVNEKKKSIKRGSVSLTASKFKDMRQKYHASQSEHHSAGNDDALSMEEERVKTKFHKKQTSG